MDGGSKMTAFLCCLPCPPSHFKAETETTILTSPFVCVLQLLPSEVLPVVALLTLTFLFRLKLPETMGDLCDRGLEWGGINVLQKPDRII